jgi:hypothetical protein
MLLARLRRRGTDRSPPGSESPGGGLDSPGRRRPDLFSMGRLGLPVNVLAVAWGVFVIVNISWPRPEIYGPDPWGRFAAPLFTIVLILLGAVYYLLVPRPRTGILAEHAAPESGEPCAHDGQWSVKMGSQGAL